MPATGPRFGVWVQIHGNWAPTDYSKEEQDASFARAKEQILSAEKAGFDSTLIANFLINPHGEDYEQLESWTSGAALAALTERIEIICAVKPFLIHPAVHAKIALGIEDISGGRFAINFVSAWFKPELEKSGIGFREHDDRYAYGSEWLTVWKKLVSGETVTFDGKFFHLSDFRLRPASRFRDRPKIYLGGESEPARVLASQTADYWFINGQPPEGVASFIADLSRRPRLGAPLRFGMAAFVIARESEEEARHVLTEFFDVHARVQWGSGLADRVDKSVAMFQRMSKIPAIGTNGGTHAGLVGSYDQVAARVAQFHRIGIDLFMLQFQPFVPEQERFAAEVIPRVRFLLSQRAA